VLITAQTGEFDHTRETGTYSGNARAWQENNYVRADRFIIHQKEGQFHADGNVQSLVYDAKQIPIALYGKANGTSLALCAIANDEEFERVIVMGKKTGLDTSGCPFSLELGDGVLTGSWSKGADKVPVSLRKVAGLDDTGEGKVEGTVEIPFWAQTATDRFAGIYSKTDNGICMTKMQVINKKRQKAVQTIKFGGELCNAGMLMTPIYWNVQKSVELGKDIISVNFYDGRAGYEEDYVFDRKTKKYRLKK